MGKKKQITQTPNSFTLWLEDIADMSKKLNKLYKNDKKFAKSVPTSTIQNDRTDYPQLNRREGRIPDIW